jgi:predicted transcriptional regulator of viral defense system
MFIQDHVPDHTKLFQLAERQGGYFTAHQAQESGFTRPLLFHHVKMGRFFRVKRGIYRLAQFPESPHADLYVAILETRSRGVLSHETALALHELSDNIPSQIHVTIPSSASRRHPGLKLHTSRLEPNEITNREGLAVTTVARTLSDVIASGMADEQVRLAIRQALERGLVSQKALVGYARKRGGRAARVISNTVSGNADP